jgi:hypothetical protein
MLLSLITVAIHFVLPFSLVFHFWRYGPLGQLEVREILCLAERSDQTSLRMHFILLVRSSISSIGCWNHSLVLLFLLAFWIGFNQSQWFIPFGSSVVVSSDFLADWWRQVVPIRFGQTVESSAFDEVVNNRG